MDAVAGIFAGLVAIIAALLKWQETRKTDAYVQAQKLREAVVNGDIQPIVDELLLGSDNSSTGSQSDKSVEERINNIIQ